jgi:hypothetical protein
MEPKSSTMEKTHIEIPQSKAILMNFLHSKANSEFKFEHSILEKMGRKGSNASDFSKMEENAKKAAKPKRRTESVFVISSLLQAHYSNKFTSRRRFPTAPV